MKWNMLRLKRFTSVLIKTLAYLYWKNKILTDATLNELEIVYIGLRKLPDTRENRSVMIRLNKQMYWYCCHNNDQTLASVKGEFAMLLMTIQRNESSTPRWTGCRRKDAWRSTRFLALRKIDGSCRSLDGSCRSLDGSCRSLDGSCRSPRRVSSESSTSLVGVLDKSSVL